MSSDIAIESHKSNVDASSGHDELLHPQFSSPAFQARLLTIATALSAQEDQIQKSFKQEKDSQGVIGKAFDAAKNFAGTNGESDVKTTPGWLWAQMLDQRAGSQANHKSQNTAADELSDLRRAAQENDLVKFGSTYRSLTGKEFDQNKTTADSLFVKRDVEAYSASQANGVEFISDLGAVACTLAALRLGQGTRLAGSLYTRMGTSFVAGAASKCLFKEVDGKYAKLPLDLLTGGINGLAFPAAAAGANLSFSGAALKHGLAVAAGTEYSSRTFVNEIREGHHIDGYQLLNNAITGYGIGYASATALLGSIAALSAGRFPH